MRRALVISFIIVLCLSCTRRGGSGSSRSSCRSTPIVYDSTNSNRRAARGPSRSVPVHTPVSERTSERATSRSTSGKVLTAQEVFKRCNPAVFMVYTTSGFQNCQGSGFFISPSGLAVSNYHVFKGTQVGAEVIKLTNGEQYRLDRVIYKDSDEDIFIFTVTPPAGRQFQYIPVSTRIPQVGDKAYAIGSPLGLENTFSSGEISQLRGSGVIQINVPIDHGSSGGALINEYGEAIGITTAGVGESGANLNFAMSIDLVKPHIR